MPEEKNAGTKEINTTTEPSQSTESTNERDTPAFRALVTQLNAERGAREKLERDIADKARLADEEAAKARGDWEKVAASAKADAESARAEARMARIESLAAGIVEEDAREGVIRKMENLPPDSDYKKFVDDYRLKRPELWQSTSFSAPASPPQGAGIANNEASNDWASLRKIIDTSSDIDLVKRAINKINEYKNKNGQYPPGTF